MVVYDFLMTARQHKRDSSLDDKGDRPTSLSANT